MHGLEKFREYFGDYTGNYILIGGTACTIILDEIGVDFRATKDLDIVLIAENMNENFAKQIWEFVKLGKYQQREKSDKNNELYRFVKPANSDFPYMIEIFSRKLSGFDLAMGSHLTPLHLADEISSLSAILLDDEYYNFMIAGKKIINGLSIIDEHHLIPFKAKAWVELCERNKQGEEGLSKHIRKHRNDIIKIFSILDLNRKILLRGIVRQDMEQFLNALKTEQIDFKNLHLEKLTLTYVCEQLYKIYLSKNDNPL